MAGRLALILLLFLLPFLLFGLYLAALSWRREQEALGTLPPWWDRVPWFWLGLSGLVLIFALLAYWRLENGLGTDGHYQAPRLENGRVIPGHLEPE